MHNIVLVRQGWIVNGQSQEVWIHRNGAALSDRRLFFALKAVAISAGSFSHRGMAKSMVCTPSLWFLSAV